MLALERKRAVLAARGRAQIVLGVRLSNGLGGAAYHLFFVGPSARSKQTCGKAQSERLSLRLGDQRSTRHSRAQRGVQGRDGCEHRRMLERVLVDMQPGIAARHFRDQFLKFDRHNEPANA